jgi:predicted pyridoxine 5'-phosphate oxidase superfamily flavin-nucleotide-binding protein
MDETLRVNGAATLSTREADLTFCSQPNRRPRLVIRVTVHAAYLHCAKALIRSALWDPSRHVDRSVMPSMGQMLKDQIGGNAVLETQTEMLARYAQEL